MCGRDFWYQASVLAPCVYLQLLIHFFCSAIPHSMEEGAGTRLLGGYDSLVELDADTPILFELRGGNGITSGRITPGAHLRIFLYPFTQWTTGISCDARCVQSDENPFNCWTHPRNPRHFNHY